jgi:DNA-binding NarL/FixJ family response regulator
MNNCHLSGEYGEVKPKLLIVDDNSMLRETTRSILESSLPKLRIFEAEDGKEALAQIKDHLPDLILMDIRLPGENGIILTGKIKALYPEIVIIIFTSYDLQEYRDVAFKNGADYFFPKASPSREKLSKMIESILADTGLI